MSWPLVPEHSSPTLLAALFFVAAAKTPTTGITPAALVGQFRLLATLLLEAVYQRRRLGLKYKVSVPFTPGNVVSTLILSVRSTSTCAPGAAHPTSAVFVRGSISMPRVRQLGPIFSVFTMAAAPLFVGSILSTELLAPPLAASSGTVW